MTAEERIRVLEEAPREGWVAFSADEADLLAYASSYAEAVAKAEEKGETEPVLVKIPPDWTDRVL